MSVFGVLSQPQFEHRTRGSGGHRGPHHSTQGPVVQITTPAGHRPAPMPNPVVGGAY